MAKLALGLPGEAPVVEQPAKADPRSAAVAEQVSELSYSALLGQRFAEATRMADRQAAECYGEMLTLMKLVEGVELIGQNRASLVLDAVKKARREIEYLAEKADAVRQRAGQQAVHGERLRETAERLREAERLEWERQKGAAGDLEREAVGPGEPASRNTATMAPAERERQEDEARDRARAMQAERDARGRTAYEKRLTDAGIAIEEEDGALAEEVIAQEELTAQDRVAAMRMQRRKNTSHIEIGGGQDDELSYDEVVRRAQAAA